MFEFEYFTRVIFVRKSESGDDIAHEYEFFSVTRKKLVYKTSDSFKEALIESFNEIEKQKAHKCFIKNVILLETRFIPFEWIKKIFECLW